MDKRTSEDINQRVEKILKEISIKEPPLDLNDVLEFLDLHRGYYDLQDPSLLQEVSHKLKIGAFKVKEIFGKIDLRGLWFPDEKKILIDSEVPVRKRRWVSSHEIGHRMLPWHKDFIFGDIAETLEPDYHEELEFEANYAASSLLFLSSRFTEESRDYGVELSSVNSLAGIYGNSKTMTLRRFVEFSHDIPIIGVVSKPQWDNPFTENEDLCRYFLKSEKFKTQFFNVTKKEVMEQIIGYTYKRRGGPVGSSELVFMDANRKAHYFEAESFYNTYDVLTLIKYKKEVPIMG